MESLTTDELLAASAELADRTAGVFDRLAGITAAASGHGVTVRVNLDGKLIGLELTGEALRLGAHGLADEIFRLTQRAAATAVAEGMTILEPVGGRELSELLR